MGEYAKKQVMRGSDCEIALSQKGGKLDIFEAEEISCQPMIITIESAPLSLGRNTRDVYIDAWEIKITGVRKGNAFIDHFLEAARTSRSSGKPFEKYTAAIKFKDPNTSTFTEIKVIDADLVEPDAFASGKVYDKQTEGFKLIGQLE